MANNCLWSFPAELLLLNREKKNLFGLFASLIIFLVQSIHISLQFLEALKYLVAIKARALHDDSNNKYFFLFFLSQLALESFFSPLLSAKHSDHLGRYHFRKHIHQSFTLGLISPLEVYRSHSRGFSPFIYLFIYFPEQELLQKEKLGCTLLSTPYNVMYISFFFSTVSL